MRVQRLFLVALLVTFVACRDDAAMSAADPGPASAGPSDAGASAADAASTNDAALPNDDASTGDAGCPPCVVGVSAVGSCCLQ